MAQEDLSDEQRKWVLRSEALWRKASAIAQSSPGVDASDAYHVLRNLELSPAERLRNGLTRVRIRRARPHTR